MPKPRLVRLAEGWTPDPDDPLGDDKKLLVDYLLTNGFDAGSPVTITQVLKDLKFEDRYSRESFQHHLLGPLRRDPQVFVGTSNAGVFLVTTPQDADATLDFYTWRIRAELRHARNLRALAKRTKLFEGYRSKVVDKKKKRAVIYLDESGSPDVEQLRPSVFVVAAVLIESAQDVTGLEQRFKNAFATIKRPEDHELRTAGLSEQKHARVLRELSLLEYQWAAACFIKSRLTSAGFQHPITFYRYAFQFLVGELLTVAWQADLVIDQNSTDEFQKQLEAYLRRQNSGLPVSRLGSVSFAESSKERLVQLADLVAGAVRRSVEGRDAPLAEIEHQMISLQFWPPREA